MVGVVLALGFVERTADRAPITDIRIDVSGEEGVHFIDELTVRREVLDQGGAVMGAPTAYRGCYAYRGTPAQHSVHRSSRGLPYHGWRAACEGRSTRSRSCACSIGTDPASISIVRAGPCRRIHDYTARVLVVTGHVNEPGAEAGVYSVYANDSIQHGSLIGRHPPVGPLHHARIPSGSP